MQYLFVLGREPHLSTAELEAVFLSLQISFEKVSHTATTLIISVKKPIDAEQLMRRLGGTVKIAEEIPSEGTTTQTITTTLGKTEDERKIHFCINGENAKQIGIQVKKSLKSAGRSVRYIEANNTATILHNHLVIREADFTIVGKQVFVTRAIQPIEEFSARDYERPAFDDRSGMLPPKLARMMINLSQATPKRDILLDPFCGSGTVLMEAVDMQFQHVIGSDMSEIAVSNTEENLTWLQEQLTSDGTNKRSEVKLFVSEITALSRHIKPKSVSTIITEPYMGKPLTGRETRSNLTNQAEELAELYADAFISYARILKDNGVVVCIIPEFNYRGEWLRVPCLPDIEHAGFVVSSLGQSHSPLSYWRKDQHVKRMIWRFVKK